MDAFLDRFDERMDELMHLLKVQIKQKFGREYEEILAEQEAAGRFSLEDDTVVVEEITHSDPEMTIVPNENSMIEIDSSSQKLQRIRSEEEEATTTIVEIESTETNIMNSCFEAVQGIQLGSKAMENDSVVFTREQTYPRYSQNSSLDMEIVVQDKLSVVFQYDDVGDKQLCPVFPAYQLFDEMLSLQCDQPSYWYDISATAEFPFEPGLYSRVLAFSDRITISGNLGRLCLKPGTNTVGMERNIGCEIRERRNKTMIILGQKTTTPQKSGATILMKAIRVFFTAALDVDHAQYSLDSEDTVKILVPGEMLDCLSAVANVLDVQGKCDNLELWIIDVISDWVDYEFKRPWDTFLVLFRLAVFFSDGCMHQCGNGRNNAIYKELFRLFDGATLAEVFNSCPTTQCSPFNIFILDRILLRGIDIQVMNVSKVDAPVCRVSEALSSYIDTWKRVLIFRLPWSTHSNIRKEENVDNKNNFMMFTVAATFFDLISGVVILGVAQGDNGCCPRASQRQNSLVSHRPICERKNCHLPSVFRVKQNFYDQVPFLIVGITTRVFSVAHLGSVPLQLYSELYKVSAAVLQWCLHSVWLNVFQGELSLCWPELKLKWFYGVVVIEADKMYKVVKCDTSMVAFYDQLDGLQVVFSASYMWSTRAGLVAVRKSGLQMILETSLPIPLLHILWYVSLWSAYVHTLLKWIWHMAWTMKSPQKVKRCFDPAFHGFISLHSLYSETMWGYKSTIIPQEHCLKGEYVLLYLVSTDSERDTKNSTIPYLGEELIIYRVLMVSTDDFSVFSQCRGICGYGNVDQSVSDKTMDLPKKVRMLMEISVLIGILGIRVQYNCRSLELSQVHSDPQKWQKLSKVPCFPLWFLYWFSFKGGTKALIHYSGCLEWILLEFRAIYYFKREVDNKLLRIRDDICFCGSIVCPFCTFAAFKRGTCTLEFSTQWPTSIMMTIWVVIFLSIVAGHKATVGNANTSSSEHAAVAERDCVPRTYLEPPNGYCGFQSPLAKRTLPLLVTQIFAIVLWLLAWCRVGVHGGSYSRYSWVFLASHRVAFCMGQYLDLLGFKGGTEDLLHYSGAFASQFSTYAAFKGDDGTSDLLTQCLASLIMTILVVIYLRIVEEHEATAERDSVQRANSAPPVFVSWYLTVFNFVWDIAWTSSLRTRMFKRGWYCHVPNM